MPGMQRFVSYINLYENEEKAGNVGFAKIEQRGEECRLEVHLRGTNANNVSCKIYLFTEKEDFIQGVPIGMIKIQNGTGDFGTIIKANKIGDTGMCFAQMNGIMIVTEDERIFATVWKSEKEIPFHMENFKVWEPPQLEAVSEKKSQSKKQPVHQQESQPKKESDQQQESQFQRQPEMQATEVPMQNIFPQLVWEEQWEKMKKSHPVYDNFPAKGLTCIRIELKDLRELPKRYWYLGNNSFLLHGFFNYRYLILGSSEQEKDEKWFLGVPGIYQHQERVMASIFGFPDFMPQAQEESKEDNKEPLNQFGYWTRQLDE